MRINIHHYHHYSEIDQMAEHLENMRRELAENREADASIILLLETVVAKVNELANNATELGELKTALAEFTQELSDDTDKVTAAVLKNTPADPEVPPPADDDFTPPPADDE